jgi:hypothetical protein
MKSNTVVLIFATLVIIGLGYWYISSQSGNDAPLTESNISDNPAQNQFQALVSLLQPITFNTDIFSDPRFTSLVDLTTPIAPEAVGRIDPFAPIPGTSGQ